MIAPFIELEILENIDDITDFFEINGYNEENVYAKICSEEGFNGYYAQLHLFIDDEVVAYIDTCSSRQELLTLIREALGNEFEISKDS